MNDADSDTHADAESDPQEDGVAKTEHGARLGPQADPAEGRDRPAPRQGDQS